MAKQMRVDTVPGALGIQQEYHYSSAFEDRANRRHQDFSLSLVNFTDLVNQSLADKKSLLYFALDWLFKVNTASPYLQSSVEKKVNTPLVN